MAPYVLIVINPYLFVKNALKMEKHVPNVSQIVLNHTLNKAHVYQTVALDLVLTILMKFFHNFLNFYKKYYNFFIKKILIFK